MAGVDAKKSKVDRAGDADHMDEGVTLSIEKMQELQDELDKVDMEACEKALEVERKFCEIRKPVFERRNEIIKNIPDFWLTAFLSHPVLSDLISLEDMKIFKYLNSLVVEEIKDTRLGYSIELNFRENPYFEDTQLSKTFIFCEDGTNLFSGTTIKWKEGMGVADGANEVTNGNKRPRAEKSFFSWFDEEEQKNAAELGDEIADIIKEDIWPNPLVYFNSVSDDDDDEIHDEDSISESEEDGTKDSEDDGEDEDDNDEVD